MQMLLIRLVSVAMTLGGAIFLTQKANPEFLAVPSVHELKIWADNISLDRFPALRQGWANAKNDVIAPGPIRSNDLAEAESQDPLLNDIPVLLQEAGNSANGSIEIPFLQAETGQGIPQTTPFNAAGFQGGLNSIDIIPEREHALAELPRISIPQQYGVPTPKAPGVPPLLPVGQSQTDKVFTPLKGVQTFLLMGSDKRDEDSTWRTDVVIIAVLDQRRGRLDMISVPRDLYIENPPRQDSNKINTFDYWGEQEEPGGGPELMKQIVLSYFGIPIDHYVRLQFTGFVKIVDAMGGIDLNVPCPLYDIKPEENLYLNLEPGRHTLDGEQALAYVRSREQGGDLSRVERQQQVLIALKQKFTVRNMVSQIPSIYTAVRSAVDTDIGLFEAIALARLAYNMNFDGINVLTMRPREHFITGWAQGMQVWLPDWDRIRGDVQLLLADSPVLVEGQVGTSATVIENQSLVAARCQ